MSPKDGQIGSHLARFLDMLDHAFRGYGVSQGLPPWLRDAVAATPRHRFVHRFRVGDGPLCDSDADPDAHLAEIYSDAVMRHVDRTGAPLPSSNSQPSYVLFLLHLLGPEAAQSVLEIGSGSGWLAAILAHGVGPRGRVVGIELLDDLADQSRADLAALGLGNVEIITGDGTRGHAPGAPYDRAIITAATWDIPAALLDELAEGGRVLVPIEQRGGGGCDVAVLRRQGGGAAPAEVRLTSERLIPGWFVPLRGGSQDGRAQIVVERPEGEPRGRHTLPLGFAHESAPAPAAALFRAFLGRTEPGFVVVPSVLRGQSSAPVAPFGLAEADGSMALWNNGEIVDYGSAAAESLARAYARWAALGLPGLGAFQVDVFEARTAPPPNAPQVPHPRVSVEARGETVLAWRLADPASTWTDLTAPAASP